MEKENATGLKAKKEVVVYKEALGKGHSVQVLP